MTFVVSDIKTREWLVEGIWVYLGQRKKVVKSEGKETSICTGLLLAMDKDEKN